MKYNFSFNSANYDFWELYETIKKYYPIGIAQREGRGIYNEYPGIKELISIVIENVHDNNNYTERWVNFTDAIGKDLDKEVIGTTYGQAPSFSASIILERNEVGDCLHSKELHFSVSLLGKFFQIYGLDTTIILEKNDQGGYSAVNVVTVSPFEEFKESFEFVEKKIKNKYPTHRIVPFASGQTIINGLQVSYLDDEICSVNMAIFNHFLRDAYMPRFTRGDPYYGSEYWKRP